MRNSSGKGKGIPLSRSRLQIIALFVIAVFAAGCTGTRQPTPNSYISETKPPKTQELRWSNGPKPKHLDPARTSSAPEADIVRGIYEGLTETEPATLEAIPGVAEKWKSTEDLKTWTFTLRTDAKWTNGKAVTAFDFVRSWKRLASLGPRAAHPQLTSNFVGFGDKFLSPDILDRSDEAVVEPMNDFQANSNSFITNTATNMSPAEPSPSEQPVISKEVPDGSKKGFYAVDSKTLVVNLKTPDPDLPRLLANPIFRPVFPEQEVAEGSALQPDVVTNGAFKIASIDETGILLEKSSTYWNHESVALDRLNFVAMESPEKALQSYRSGELDAVTNAGLEPLAIKLLEPFEDFRKNTFAALNFYMINTANAPFNDRRVRQALSISIERERLTEGELSGTTRPAYSFLPFASGSQNKLNQDRERARDILDEAGFPNGRGFPKIRLVVNRNDAQQRVARSVGRMWKQNLNLETEIIVKENTEMAATLDAGDYDLIRRGVVLPSSNKTMGLKAIFENDQIQPAAASPENVRNVNAAPTGPVSNTDPLSASNSDVVVDSGLTEEIALYEMEAIPLYFPTSYSLVKPYVLGFEIDVFDAPFIQRLRIDNSWQPKTSEK